MSRIQRRSAGNAVRIRDNAGMIGLLLCAAALFAQSPAPRPAFDAFEVSTVKRTPSDGPRGRWIRMQTARQFVAHGFHTRLLIGAAYNLPPSAISGGPSWIDSDLYDILAETPGNVRPNIEEQMKMVRSLIAERFRLKFHREDREMPVYAFSIAKGGSKLRGSAPVTAPEGPPLLAFVIAPDAVRLPGHSASLAEMCAIFQRTALDRPVIDRTGLTGRYDFDLEFTPDESQFGGQIKTESPDEAKRPPDLLNALQQQLGLRLDATRGTISTMVIESIERPSEN